MAKCLDGASKKSLKEIASVHCTNIDFIKASVSGKNYDNQIKDNKRIKALKTSRDKRLILGGDAFNLRDRKNGASRINTLCFIF